MYSWGNYQATSGRIIKIRYSLGKIPDNKTTHPYLHNRQLNLRKGLCLLQQFMPNNDAFFQTQNQWDPQSASIQFAYGEMTRLLQQISLCGYSQSRSGAPSSSYILMTARIRRTAPYTTAGTMCLSSISTLNLKNVKMAHTSLI